MFLDKIIETELIISEESPKLKEYVDNVTGTYINRPSNELACLEPGRPDIEYGSKDKLITRLESYRIRYSRQDTIALINRTIKQDFNGIEDELVFKDPDISSTVKRPDGTIVPFKIETSIQLEIIINSHIIVILEALLKEINRIIQELYSINDRVNAISQRSYEREAFLETKEACKKLEEYMDSIEDLIDRKLRLIGTLGNKANISNVGTFKCAGKIESRRKIKVPKIFNNSNKLWG